MRVNSGNTVSLKNKKLLRSLSIFLQYHKRAFWRKSLFLQSNVEKQLYWFYELRNVSLHKKLNLLEFKNCFKQSDLFLIFTLPSLYLKKQVPRTSSEASNDQYTKLQSLILVI